MSPDAEENELMALVRCSDEELNDVLDEVREWGSGPLPMLTFVRCAFAWPKVRVFALKEWEEQLADPFGEAASNSLPTLGWYLAAANRDVEFLPPFLEGLKLESEAQDALFGDVLTMNGPALAALMASRSPEGIDLLENAAQPDSKVDPFYNNLPIDALAILVGEGVVERQRFDRISRHYIDALSSADFAADANERRTMLVSCLCDLGVGGFADEVRSWFDRGMMESGPRAIVDREFFEEAATRGPETPYSYWHGKGDYDQISEDAYDAMRWMMHENTEEEDDLVDEEEEFMDFDSSLNAILAPPAPKIGRNEPCPCGSGKKFKKCCGKIA